MPSAKLTALQIDRAHRKGEPVKLGDGGGLVFRKQTPEGAGWVLRYRFAGGERFLTLGNYPDMSLAKARTEASQARLLIDQGKDPLAAKRAAIEQLRGRGTFRQLAEDWFRIEIEGRNLKHPEVPRRHLDNYLLPDLGRTAAAEVHAADIARLLDKVKGRAPTAANDLLRYARRIFDFGVRRQMLVGNPAAGFTPRLDAGGTERARKRALAGDELASLFKALRKSPTFGGDNFLAIRLLLALCVRKGELLAARWGEFELERKPAAGGPVWHLPASRTKTGEALDIPLVSNVVAWLRTLKELSAGSEFVFPQRRRDHRQRVPHVGLDTLNVAVTRVEHGLEPFTLHDLRRTARTHLARLGVSREVAERCLGHKIGGVEATYDRHDYFNERRDALAKWTALLHDAELGEHKVTPFRRKALTAK
jgi:integrase